MSSVSPIVRRALLYVPSSSQKMLKKSCGLDVDCVAYDLEDSVTVEKKEEARENLRRFLQQPKAEGIRERAVRINSIGTGLACSDLEAVCTASSLDAIVIPKVTSGSDLRWAADFVEYQQNRKKFDDPPARPPKILALIESAKAISDLGEICRATPLLSGLIFAAEDFALDLSLTRTPSLTEFLYARSAIATFARAHDLPSTIDLVCTLFKGQSALDTLEKECINGKGLGFNGKQCIHPAQVAIAHRAFAPSEKELTWAVRVVVADAKASKEGRGAWTLDDEMIDLPVVTKAKRMVIRAEACGIDVRDLREKWKPQEPQ